MNYPFHAKGYSQYGASMGRRSDPTISGKVHLVRVPLYGDYDKGGAYWGARSNGQSLWCAYSDETGDTLYLEARSRNEAKANPKLSGCTFYR